MKYNLFIQHLISQTFKGLWSLKIRQNMKLNWDIEKN